MTRVPFKKSSNFGYQNSPTVGTSSFRSNNYRKDKGVVDASNITMIKDVDPMLENITVHGRCISLWHSHRLNEAHNPYSLDMVLQDSQKANVILFSTFAIAENSGILPLLPHKYKISFYKGTVVTRIIDFDNNVNGFILEPFNRLLDGTHQYHEHEAVDIIGSVVAIGDAVPMQSAAGRKIRRTVVIEDSELKELPEYDENQFKISLFTPQKHVVTISEFFNGAVKKMVSSISSSSAGKSKVTFYCEDHGVLVPCKFASRKKGSNFIDPILSRILDMQTPTSVNGDSGSGGSSGTSSRRLKKLQRQLSDIKLGSRYAKTPNKENKGLKVQVEVRDSKRSLMAWMTSKAMKMKAVAATRILSWFPLRWKKKILNCFVIFCHF
ncbi:replication protein A 70 kDa DNA-binding subunit B [Tanacetum coccineum]